MTPELDFPVSVGPRGAFATTGRDDHVRDLIMQVLFTSPGERVNRPDFGCGLRQLVFMPRSDVLAAATEFLVQGALERWLSDLIRVERVKVGGEDDRLEVEVTYVRRDSGERRRDLFRPPGA